MDTQFSDAEVAYLKGQILGRLATVGPGGRPHVTPVGFSVDADRGTIVIRGYNMAETKKFRDAERHPEVAFVVDDLASTDPWRPRGIEVRGLATTHAGEPNEAEGRLSGAYIEIHPRRIRRWGIEVAATVGP